MYIIYTFIDMIGALLCVRTCTTSLDDTYIDNSTMNDLSTNLKNLGSGALSELNWCCLGKLDVHFSKVKSLIQDPETKVMSSL